MNQLKGYRTIILNIAAVAILGGGYLSGTVTDPATLSIISTVVAIANGVLRAFTDTPVGKAS